MFPLIGQRPISSIGAPDLLAVIRRIEGREAFETARKTLQTCRQVFRYPKLTEVSAMLNRNHDYLKSL
ncbi:hypothetical protein L3V59_08405 [Burkholderia aenigmatica]|uniref:phage integrase central domain-containing protein n=1 Tax=Burkholderia aenigmatica TaxID=2015348 RepID=UPI001F2146BC|nr:hypothetical protein [Burkholderia aenigmatica]UKD13056.1 hypothetical protein L3V59_08405 [Burkholderia aenigmatica]